MHAAICYPEGIKPETVIKTGSPMKEVLKYYMPQIGLQQSKVLDETGQPLVTAKIRPTHSRPELHIQFNTSCEVLAAYYIRDDHSLLLGSSTLLEGVGLISGDKEDRLIIEFSTRLPLADGSYSTFCSTAIHSHYS